MSRLTPGLRRPPIIRSISVIWRSSLPCSFVPRTERADRHLFKTAWGGTPIRRHVQGGDIYANHIAPLEGFHVAGVLWYQGCNDSTNEATALAYESQMTLLINQYREVFDQDDLPFLYVQLARWPGYQYTQNVRFAQLNTLSNAGLRNASNVAMTVSLIRTRALQR